MPKGPKGEKRPDLGPMPLVGSFRPSGHRVRQPHLATACQSRYGAASSCILAGNLYLRLSSLVDPGPTCRAAWDSPISFGDPHEAGEKPRRLPTTRQR